jgi:hypothetical protein
MTETVAGDNPPCSCKVATAAGAYGLDGIHGELAQRWGRTDGPSVRALAESFNTQCLQAAFRRAGRFPLDGEVANAYHLLTDNDVDPVEQSRAREQLRQDGIDVATVEDRFVSHQTMYRHLTECLDVTHEKADHSDSERIETWRDRLRALENRTDRVTARAVQQLTEAGAIDITKADVSVDVSVACESCGGFYRVEELFDVRRCDCHTSD